MRVCEEDQLVQNHVKPVLNTYMCNDTLYGSKVLAKQFAVDLQTWI
jgi:hypothetical protein